MAAGWKSRRNSSHPCAAPVMGFSLCLITLHLLLSQCTAQWCYQRQFCDDSCKDPSRWETEFPRCGGLHQSPINIVTRNVHVNDNLPPLVFIGYTDIINITVENKGHSGNDADTAPSIKRSFLWKQKKKTYYDRPSSPAAHFALPPSVRLTGGALPGYYRAAQFHFHWGGNGRPGSEHTIDGERFPMELHIVHIKEPYNSLAEAQHDMAGIALLAFLFEETTDDHPHLDTVIAALGLVQNNGSTTVIPNFHLSDIIPPASDLHHYYRYVGSMTTPGCEHAVAWTVFHRTLPISSRQLDAIVKQCRFWTGLPMTDIYRPTQPLDGRIVYRTNSGTVQRRVLHMCIRIFLAVLFTLALTH
ncbi:carbonic anhydrase 4 isoform X1 [Oryzias melastigma]|uniref:carbonic anhydrase 4 isoform X1 n=1 Tax=Oryzias melastigma TaxID=30732 RepID=UPI00168D3C42|nr:carbonic anhydrase 4 isoform X1 [Oryzias melastigma]